MGLALPQDVVIKDVSPRDGLQAEPTVITTDAKIALIDGLARAGLPRVEATSAVKPGLLPQLADAEDTMARLTRRSRCRYSVLVPNLRGAERALTMNPDEMTVFLSASETHNWKNVHRTIVQSLEECQAITDLGRRRGVVVSAVIVTAFGCPYEGTVTPSVVMELAFRLYAMGIREVTLGDTVGVANPVMVEDRVRMLHLNIPGLTLGLHFHDNRGTALANMLAALDAGATHFETALGGIGGSPFSPGAGGNLATEDAVYLLEEMGVHTGIDLDALLVLGDRLSDQLGHPFPSRVRQARGRMIPVGPEGQIGE